MKYILFKQPAHIEDMGRFFLLILIAGILFFLLFFPIYITTDAHYDMNGRKLAFCIRVYNVLKLIGGYIATYQGGLAIHVSDNKAILLPYKDLKQERKRISVMRTFRLKTLRLTVESGPEYLLPSLIGEGIFKILFLSMGGKRERIENNTWLTDGDVLRISVQFTFRFNLYIILRNFIKAVKEKIKVLCQTKIKNSTT